MPDLTPNPAFAAAASRERLETARDALNANGIATEIVSDAPAAKAAVMALVPDGAEAHVALSATMQEIGVTAVVASGSGSQLGPYANGAGQVILVAGAQKVVRDLDEAMRRVHEYSYPMEDARMKSVGRPGTKLAQVLILSYFWPGRVHLFLTEERLGF